MAIVEATLFDGHYVGPLLHFGFRALDMGVPRVEARVESDAVPALLVSGCAKRRQGMVARV